MTTTNTEQPFLTDIQELRRRAREQIDKGALTQDYGLDPKQAIDLLQSALATEIVCVLRYTMHSIAATGIASQGPKDEFAQHADEEREHAGRIAERINQLGGTPNFDPEGLAMRSASQYGESELDLVGDDQGELDRRADRDRALSRADPLLRRTRFDDAHHARRDPRGRRRARQRYVATCSSRTEGSSPSGRHTVRVQLICVRHGRTAWNADKRFQGHTDIPLDDEGRAQATALAALLRNERIDAAASSDLARAAETARIVLGPRDVALRLDPDWREMQFGDWEGLTWEQILAANPQLDATQRDGGESLHAGRRRDVRRAVRGASRAPSSASPARCRMTASRWSRRTPARCMRCCACCSATRSSKFDS